jgi:ABC-2 type transport system ATP-binding protein
VIHRGRLVRELEAADLNAFLNQRLCVSARDPDSAERALTTAGFAPVRLDTGALVLTDARSVREPDAVATVLVAAGCPPTRLVVEQDDLETFFLREVES